MTSNEAKSLLISQSQCLRRIQPEEIFIRDNNGLFVDLYACEAEKEHVICRKFYKTLLLKAIYSLCHCLNNDRCVIRFLNR